MNNEQCRTIRVIRPGSAGIGGPLREALALDATPFAFGRLLDEIGRGAHVA